MKFIDKMSEEVYCSIEGCEPEYPKHQTMSYGWCNHCEEFSINKTQNIIYHFFTMRAVDHTLAVGIVFADLVL